MLGEERYCPLLVAPVRFLLLGVCQLLLQKAETFDLQEIKLSAAKLRIRSRTQQSKAAEYLPISSNKCWTLLISLSTATLVFSTEGCLQLLCLSEEEQASAVNKLIRCSCWSAAKLCGPQHLYLENFVAFSL
ncbi:hypothetical protein L1987_87125 [Smallanthus sonchifolius]|nr:hypothetical protein L1987_87125 [Smallanthus sonchifolius]